MDRSDLIDAATSRLINGANESCWMHRCGASEHSR